MKMVYGLLISLFVTTTAAQQFDLSIFDLNVGNTIPAREDGVITSYDLAYVTRVSMHSLQKSFGRSLRKYKLIARGPKQLEVKLVRENGVVTLNTDNEAGRFVARLPGRLQTRAGVDLNPQEFVLLLYIDGNKSSDTVIEVLGDKPGTDRRVGYLPTNSKKKKWADVWMYLVTKEPDTWQDTTVTMYTKNESQRTTFVEYVQAVVKHIKQRGVKKGILKVTHQ